jgi:hypothetical protein
VPLVLSIDPGHPRFAVGQTFLSVDVHLLTVGSMKNIFHLSFFIIFHFSFFIVRTTLFAMTNEKWK